MVAFFNFFFVRQVQFRAPFGLLTMAVTKTGMVTDKVRGNMSWESNPQLCFLPSLPSGCDL